MRLTFAPFTVTTLVVFGLLVLAGCSRVLESTPHAVWIDEPLISFRSAHSVAEAECSKYGKRAVPDTVLVDSSQNKRDPQPTAQFVPIAVFRCR